MDGWEQSGMTGRKAESIPKQPGSEKRAAAEVSKHLYCGYSAIDLARFWNASFGKNYGCL